MTRPIVLPAPSDKTYRVSSDSVWPLRGIDGKTFAERHKERQEKNGPSNC